MKKDKELSFRFSKTQRFIALIITVLFFTGLMYYTYNLNWEERNNELIEFEGIVSEPINFYSNSSEVGVIFKIVNQQKNFNINSCALDIIDHNILKGLDYDDFIKFSTYKSDYFKSNRTIEIVEFFIPDKGKLFTLDQYQNCDHDNFQGNKWIYLWVEFIFMMVLMKIYL